MATRDPRIDDYIARAQPFARPILEHIREVVHKACPEVQETMKWSMPHFDYKGMLCGMASFKAHATFGFRKAKLLVDAGVPEGDRSAMGQFGCLTSVKDLPGDRALARMIKAAMALNEQGVRAERVKVPKKAPVQNWKHEKQA